MIIKKYDFPYQDSSKVDNNHVEKGDGQSKLENNDFTDTRSGKIEVTV